MASSSVRSVARAFEILGIFAHRRRPMSLRDLGAELDYPTSSLADLLKTLCDVECLSFDSEAKTYFPTTRLAILGDWVSDELIRQRDAYVELERLRSAFGEKILLAARNDLFVQYLYVLDGRRRGAWRERRKQQRPLVQSGVGWMLLSAARDSTIERLWRRSASAGLVDRGTFPLSALAARIGECRRQGHVCAPDGLDPGAALIATLLPDAAHGRPLALAISGPSGKIRGNERHIAGVLRREAAKNLGDLAEAARLAD